MSTDWDIRPRNESCDGCDQAFADRQAYHSALIFGENGYARQDYCAACWQRVDQAESLQGRWQGIFRLPAPPPEEALKRETAESLLRRFMEEEDETRGNVIYILAVMLERKRLLIERSVQDREDGSIVRIYEHRRSGETFVIPDPGLDLDQLEGVQTEVVELLGGRSPSAPADAAPAGVAEDEGPSAGGEPVATDQ